MIEHRIRTDYSVEGRTYWECNCGSSGSVPEWNDVDIASDRHIDYDNGDHRVDVSGGA